MTPPTSLPARVAGGLLLLVLTGGLTSCGAAEGASPVASTTRVDPALHDQLPASVQESGVLRVGTDASYAPMSSFGPDGRTIIGVEPDLGADLGRVLGVKVRFVNVSFTSLLGQVRTGKVDLAMSAITDTPARSQSVDFVNYFSAGTAIVVQRGNPAGITDITDLCGKVTAVEKGVTQVDLLERAQKNCPTGRIHVRTFPTNSDALVQLRTGRAVAVLNDLPPAVALTTGPRTKSQYQLVSTTQYEPGLYGIAVAKTKPALRDAVRGALERLMRDHAYSSTLTRWAVRGGAVDRISVNSDR